MLCIPVRCQAEVLVKAQAFLELSSTCKDVQVRREELVLDPTLPYPSLHIAAAHRRHTCAQGMVQVTRLFIVWLPKLRLPRIITLKQTSGLLAAACAYSGETPN